jgi:hypothetical protein
MEALSLRGAANSFMVGLFFGMGFAIAANILRLVGQLIGAR